MRGVRWNTGKGSWMCSLGAGFGSLTQCERVGGEPRRERWLEGQKGCDDLGGSGLTGTPYSYIRTIGSYWMILIIIDFASRLVLGFDFSYANSSNQKVYSFYRSCSVTPKRRFQAGSDCMKRMQQVGSGW